LVRVWDAMTGREILSLRGHVTKVKQVAWSPDGRRLAAADYFSVRIWDAPGWKCAAARVRPTAP